MDLLNISSDKPSTCECENKQVQPNVMDKRHPCERIKLLIPTVPPVLKNVGKLAAGVAGVASGSATGNPRNKTALQPGHSLMDWIRLSHSGQDLTGVGVLAGTLSVSPKQLAEHNTENDAWIAIRGKVYNVTKYFHFHPGGKDELMKGIGQDATQMFNAIHAWVNYESILQKCFIGRLTSIEPDVNTLSLFYNPSQLTVKVPAKFQISPKDSTISENPNGAFPDSVEMIAPKFDWIQQLDYITTIFYTKPLINPEIKVTAPTKDNELDIIIIYDNHICKNHMHFATNIHWPCKVILNWDTGKIEINFRKIVSSIWDTYGTMTQHCKKVPEEYGNKKIKYVVLNRVKENYNTYLIALQRIDGVKQTIPIGYYVKLYALIDNEEFMRCYTPIPCNFMRKYSQDYDAYRGDVCLLIKEYNGGLLSPVLCNSVKGDTFELSPPVGTFNLEKIAHHPAYLMLAGGSGITPILGLMKFLLESETRKCEKITLLFFNRTEKDLFFCDYLNYLQETDDRIKVKFIISEPSNSWKGLTGRLNMVLLKLVIDEQCKNTSLFPIDIYSIICGPLDFTNLAKSLLSDIGYTEDNMHLFGA